MISGDVLEILAGLAAKSLAMVEHPEPNATRYPLLQTMRVLGRDKLVEHGDLQIRQERHAAWVLALV